MFYLNSENLNFSMGSVAFKTSVNLVNGESMDVLIEPHFLELGDFGNREFYWTEQNDDVYDYVSFIKLIERNHLENCDNAIVDSQGKTYSFEEFNTMIISKEFY